MPEATAKSGSVQLIQSEKFLKIVHIIIGLNTGGAELMLRKILLNELVFKHEVISLTSVGSIGESLCKNNIKITALGLTKYNVFVVFFRLIAYLLRTKPNVVQTWMYHSDLLGGIAAKLCGIHRIFWNIRNTEIPQKKASLTSVIVRLCSILSYFVPCKIICCANSSKDHHANLGYCSKKIVVIPNGYMILKGADYKPKKNFRKKFCIDNNVFVVGMIGRYDYLKGYDILIKAASRLVKKMGNNTVFLCAGKNIDWSNQSLVNYIKKLGVEKNFRLIGEVCDIDSLYSAMDIFCLSSRAEGFPNVVAEAMLSSLPCVVTDVGDAAIIVGDHGLVIPPNNHLALSNGITHFYKMDSEARKSIAAKGRIRIVENYDLDMIVRKYIKEYMGDCQNE